ncbi:MAG: DUF4091 domain-containing protein [Clostridia bacterium]|nr:DUF4091 domain-containing protein [Clostridia bacterium]
MPSLDIRPVSALVKVFPDADPGPAYAQGSALRGEKYSFQIAYRAPRLTKGISVKAETGALPAALHLFRVGLVPAELTGYGDGDDFLLRDAPGLYPDPLYPLEEGAEITAYPNQWRTLFCSVEIPEDAETGIFPLRVRLESPEGESAETVFTLSVLSPVLPRQTVLHTDWFACDCVTTWYQLTPFTVPWWDMIEKYMENAARHGINMLLTPLYTPPLDTRVGGERPTIQLAEIEKSGEHYTFSFERLGRWMALCKKHGVEWLEMPHLFTQWGAKFTPKIVVRENGEEKKLFGWHVDAESKDYKVFLQQYLPTLLNYLKGKWPLNKVCFHLSDEPHENAAEPYARLSAFVRPLIGDCPLMDAMSSLKLFQASDLTFPVIATDAAKPFLDAKVQNLWVYYCCGQYKNRLSNRFFTMSGCRTRVIGLQLYRHGIRGFLHWGYNFWYSGLSIHRLNPFEVTDAGGYFPSGDAFVVYPGPNGPINSLRMELMLQAFQDHRALTLLEACKGREEALRVLEAGIPPITFTEYPPSDQWLLDVRERINFAIAACQNRS